MTHPRMTHLSRFSIFARTIIAPRTLACALAIASAAAPVGAQTAPGQTPSVNETLNERAPYDAARSPACEHPALGEADRLACARAWLAAKDDQERTAVIERYGAMAKGNTIEGDGVPTAAPPSDRTAPPVVPSGAEGSVATSDAAWLLAVGGGALILGLGIAFGVLRTRGRKSAAAQAAQDRGTNAAYGRTPPP